MEYTNTHQFPQWVLDYNPFLKRDGWPKEWQPITNAIYKKAEEITVSLPKPTYVKGLNNFMRCNPAYYEGYTVIDQRDSRPSEWDYLYNSSIVDKYRGGITETVFKGRHLLMGFDHD